MSSTMTEWALAVKNLLFPIFCKHCGIRLLTEENRYFCPTCWESSPRIERPFCPSCGKPHAAGVGLGTRSNFLCGPCSTTDEKRPYRRILAPAVYDEAIAEAIRLFKFNDKRMLAIPLGDLLRECAAQELDCAGYDYIVPVPLHRVRHRSRGFNQAEVLAREVLMVFPNAKLDTTLKRIRPTRVLSKIRDDKLRRSSVRGAFNTIGAEHLRGKTVLLLDDVVTTSSTITECAAVLKKSGVTVVDVLAVALALPRSDGDIRARIIDRLIPAPRRRG